MPLVSVIVPTYRHWPALAACLEALAAQTLPADAVEILIVNNDPSDAAPTSLRLPGNARLLCEAAPGSYAARNRALGEARGELLAFTDADCLPAADWLAAATAAISADVPRIAGAVELLFSSARLNAAECFEKAFSFQQERYVRRGTAVTANLIVHRSVFERVGPFDARLLSGGDFAWNLAATRAGVPLVYVPQCRVRHPARASRAALFEKHRRIAGAQGFSPGERQSRLLLGFLPSLYAARQLREDRSMDRREKLLAFLMHYQLKAYRTAVDCSVRLGWSRPARR
ncbi:glycosyltransferase [Pseudohaliea sp.]|uniref:glycosyltransferase family 2 protein n=1 Tax=Pseudohaliea sp. TaxID=2740289 RepID=UPI0032EC7BF2